MNMYKILTLFALLFVVFFCSGAEKTELEPINLLGVVNPVSFAISPDGLKMVVVDCPKKSLPVVKLASRPYLESSWGAADPISAINQMIGEKIKVDAPCFSFDGLHLYFSANFSDSKGGMDLYFCNVENGKFSAPINLGATINSELNENHPSISGNNRSLNFTRNIEIKKLEDFSTGEIWVSQIDSASEKWLQPEKLNTEINNGGISYPKIYDDNMTLIYSRIRDDKEKWEICWAKKMGDIHWYLPVEIDTLNCKMSEICPNYCKADKQIYFLVNENSDSKPECKLFKFELDDKFKPEKTIVIKGKVLNPINNSPVAATLLVTDLVLSRIKFQTTADSKTGEWKMLLNASETMMFHVFKENFSHQYMLFADNQTDKDFSHNFSLFPNTELTVNIYDQEELFPLDGDVKVKDSKGKLVDVDVQNVVPGKKKFTLPIGADYLVTVSVKDYYSNTLDLALSNIVLFDEFVRDIELVPVKREVEIFVTDEETKNLLPAQIELYDFRRGVRFRPEIVPGHEGHFKTTLREGEKFDVEVRGPKGFAFNHAEIDLDKDRTFQRLNVELKPLKRKVAIRLNNINFEFNSADLMESSHEELDRVLQLLKDNPDIKLEIMAHTDDKGTDKYNSVLAEKRAKSVVDYLVMSGAESNRLVSKGYGESVPLVPNDSDENRAINRRVEMKILDLDDETNTSK